MTEHGEQASYAAQDLREYVEGRTRHSNRSLSPGALLMPDSEETSLWTFLEDVYEPAGQEDPWDLADTEIGRTFLRRHGSQKARQAVRDGNISEQRYLTGRLDTDLDVSGLHGIKALSEIINRTAWICYLAGHMGNGKTDFALLMVQIWRWDRDVPAGNVATNVRSAASRNGFTYVASYGALRQWLEETPGAKLFVFDEASGHASGYSQDAQQVQKKISPMMKLIRKQSGSLVFIGHTGKDVHPDVRRLATAVDKTDKKLATFYQDRDPDTQEGVDEIISLEGIPQTTLDYDTLEESEWSWSEIAPDSVPEPVEQEQDLTERNLEIYERWVDGGETQQDLADDYGLTKQRISQICSEVEEAARDVLEQSS